MVFFFLSGSEFSGFFEDEFFRDFKTEREYEKKMLFKELFLITPRPYQQQWIQQ